MSGRAAAELACVAPAYLDLTFLGLEELPGPGQERFARGLLRSPGGGALMAIAAARLGVSTVAAFGLGADAEGGVLRAALEEADVDLVGAPAQETAVTVVLPFGGERAMVTHEPEGRLDRDAIAALEPKRVLCCFEHLADLPPGPRAFVILEDRDLRPRTPEPLKPGRPIDTLFANEREALALTRAPDPERAVRALAGYADTAVVTLGAAGALACAGGTVVSAAGIGTDAVDTTGAGDLFASAWIWGDVVGLGPPARLRWAVLYASLSVAVPTGVAGALALPQLLAEGEKRGLHLDREAPTVVPGHGKAMPQPRSR